MSAQPKDPLAALLDIVGRDPYRVLGLAAVVGIAGGAGLWRVLLGTGARLAVAAAAPSLIDAIQRGENGHKEKSHA